MKILVIFTGGTIGSRLENGWIGPNESLKHTLINNYRSAYADDIEFIPLEPYSILSENLSANKINILIKTVCENLNSDYDGIIVTHGTDTLQYSAAALSFAVGEKSIPIVLVSSNYPLSDERSNGNANFAAAAKLIKSKLGNGVYVAYKNDGECVKFHRGTKLLAHREADDAVFSMGGCEFTEQDIDNGLKVNIPSDNNVALGCFELCRDPKILVIDAHPGDNYAYSIERYNAVILKPYHSGTLNTSNTAFISFCKKAKSNSIPVFVANVRSGDWYESSKKYNNLGLIPLLNSTFITSYIKVWIAISLKKDIKSFLS